MAKCVSGVVAMLRARQIAYQSGLCVLASGYILDTDCPDCHKCMIQCQACVEAARGRG